MSAAGTVTPKPAEFGRFDGGRKLMTLSGGVGVVALVLTLVGMFVGSDEWKERAAYSYLMGFAYWTAIVVATLIFLAIFHTAKVKWVTVVRRPLEVVASTVVVMALLSIPLYLVAPKLYIWWHDAEELFHAGRITEEQIHHLEHKQHGYLNVPFFFVRQVIYWGVWILISGLLARWSREQDEKGGLEFMVKMRKLSPGVLPLLALTMTFASFDWLMSLTPLWQSTIFGVYYFSGGLMAAIAVWILFSVNALRATQPGSAVSADHLHNQGKFLLAFVIFWAYIAFSQFVLMWVANLPEEVPFYSVRMHTGWGAFSVALVITHLIIPLAALLSRDLKRNPKGIAIVAAYLLVAQYVDMMWMVLPSRYPGGFTFVWTDVTALLGVGGIALAFGLSRLRGNYPVPVKDPYLPEALRYIQP